jgi:hypothetical protein
MSSIRILTNRISEGARALQDAIAERIGTTHVVNIENLRYRTYSPRTNIKWGTFGVPGPFNDQTVLNNGAGNQVLNKLRCFQVLGPAGVPIPEYTTDRDTALNWFDGVRAGRMRVYERHNLTGSEGDGIVVTEDTLSLGVAPLYTKGLRGVRREYRIHVFQHEGIKRYFIQQKKRRAGFQETPGYTNTVRNLAGGWIFANQDIVAPRQQTIDAAVGAVTALSLDFGAVDLIEMHDVTQGSYVLEVNSAPGLSGATIEFYANALVDLVEGVSDEEPEEEEPQDEPDYDDVDYDEDGDRF